MKAAVYLVAIGALALPIAAACGPRQHDMEAQPAGDSPPEVRVEIENRNRQNAHVYLLLSDERTYLGQVPAQVTRTLSFAARPTQVRFEISFTRGGQGFISQPLAVSPDDQLVLTITADGRLLRCPFARCPR